MIWAQVYDAAGNLLGPGPLTNIKSASVTRVLDGPGEVSLEVPLADTRVQDLIVNERRVKLYTADPGVEPGVTENVTPDSVSTLDDTASYPATNTIDGDAATYWWPDGADSTKWTLIFGAPSAQAIRVLGYRLTFPTGGSSGHGPKSWTAKLDDTTLIDTQTAVATWSSGESRDYLFAAPLDLVDGGSMVYFNIFAAQTGGYSPVVAEFAWIVERPDVNTLTAREIGIGIIREIKGSNNAAMQTLSGPDQLDELRRKNTLLARKYDGVLVADVVDALVGLASGWTADTTDTPANGVFVRFDGASVLKALQETAKQQGLHFRRDGSQAIKFGPLGDAAPLRVIQTGHRIMRALELNDDVALIDTLTWKDNSSDVVNWMIPLGGGQGEAALTLQHCTRGQDRVDWLTGYSSANRQTYTTLQGPGTVKTKLAQSFTLSAEGFVASVLLCLRKFGSPTGTLTLRIETDSSDAPSGTLADVNFTTTKNEADLSATAWVDEVFTFATGATLPAGTYWLVLSTSRSLSTTNFIRWGGDCDSPTYTGGIARHYTGSAWTNTTPLRDNCFAVRTMIESRITNVIAEYLESNLDCWVSLARLALGELSYSGASFSASTETAGNEAQYAFDNDPDTGWLTSFLTTTGWLRCTFAAAKTIYQYRVHSSGDQAPRDWTIQAGGVVVDTQTNQTFAFGETRTYTLAVPTAASQWEINITANNGSAIRLQVNEFDLIGYPAGKSKLAQAFVGDGGRVKSVKLPLIRKGTPPGNLTVKIQTASGSSPSGTTITDGTSGTVAASGLPLALTGWTEFTFSTPPICAVGTTYWIVLETTDADSATNFVLWGADGSSPSYADGEMKSYAGAWAAESKDGVFQVLAECVVEPYAVQTTTGPDGRTLYYLADADSITTYGQIERIFTADITPLSMSATDLMNAANALYDAAVAYLSRYKAAQSTYGVTLKKAYANLLPGQLIRVTYKGFVTDQDGSAVSWRDLDDTFWIIKVTENLGAGETTLEISNIDRAQQDVAALIVGTMEAVSLKNVQVQPYPTIYPYSGQDTVGAYVTYARGEGYGDTVLGKPATFEIMVPNLILSITKAVLHIQTRPLGLSGFVNAVAGTNAQFVYAYSPIEDDNYPAYITAVMDDGNVGDGPWLTANENEPLDLEIDVTDLLSDNGAPRYGNHTLTVTCGTRTTGGVGDDHAVAGFTSLVHNGTHGIVMVHLAIHCVTQAVKT